MNWARNGFSWVKLWQMGYGSTRKQPAPASWRNLFRKWTLRILYSLACLVRVRDGLVESGDNSCQTFWWSKFPYQVLSEHLAAAKLMIF